VLMAVEHAPPGRRGFYGSWPQIGVPAGLALSTAVFAIFSRLPEDQFLSWGWRVPFLVSAVLVGVGLVIRMKIVETPAFTKVKEQSAEARQPIVEVLRTYPREVLLAMGARVAENGAFYIYSAFVLAYWTQQLKQPQPLILNAMLFAAICELAAIPFYGALSDRLGRRPVYLFGAIMTAVLAFPLFWLLETGSVLLMTVAMFVVFMFSHAPMYGPQAAFLSEMFGTRVRYSGASLGSQLASVLAGGLSPIIAAALLRAYGRTAVAWYVIFMAVVTIVAVLAASETHREDIE